MLELQLFVYVFVGTAIIDKDFRLFKVGSGGKWGVAIFWPPDVMLDGTFSWTMEVHSRDDAVSHTDIELSSFNIISSKKKSTEFCEKSIRENMGEDTGDDGKEESVCGKEEIDVWESG